MLGKNIKSERMKANTNVAGHLYYIRLKTNFGIFYKIGFTTKESVHERFKLNGSSDYKFIDKVFLFKYLPDAYKIE